MPFRTESCAVPDKCSFRTKSFAVVNSPNSVHNVEKGIYTFPSESKEPEKFPWLRCNYDRNKESPLCQNCRQLDFDYIFRTNYPDEICLGDFKTVRDRNCALCRMIISDLRIVPLFRNGGIEDSDLVILSPHCDSNWETETHEMAKFPSNALSICVSRLSLDTIQRINFGVAHGTLLERSEHQNNAQIRLGEGARIPSSDEYDPETIRSWLRDCPSSTRPRLDISDQKNEPFHHIERFIDTRESRLVEVCCEGNLQIPSSTPFAALSYVWGKNGQQVTLTKSVKQRFHQKNGIASAGLSKTIADAICLCQDIGVRYLWVDALCIVQDDETSAKMKQINNLHHVFLNAAVTIVAAFGDNADAGLPRVDRNCSASGPAMVKIQHRLLFKGFDLDDALFNAYWNNRAWTFQEFILSPRKLIVTKDMIYFLCPHGVRSEHAMSPSHSSKWIYRGDLERSGLDFKMKTQYAWSIYADLVSNYTTRHLTNKGDVLPALAALSEVLREELYSSCPFVFGLPFCSLDAALLWRRCLGCPSCENTSRGLDRRRLDDSAPWPDFAPSWSWASWIGHIQYSSWIMGCENPSWSVIPKVKWLEVPKQVTATDWVKRINGTPLTVPKEAEEIKTWRPPDFLWGMELYKPTGWLRVAGGTDMLNSFIYREPVTRGFSDKNLVHPVTHHLLVEADVAGFILGGRQFGGNCEIRESNTYLLENDNDGGNPIIMMGGQSGNPIALFDIDTKSHCGVVYDDFDLSTEGVKPGTKALFVKLSQTLNGEIIGGGPPESLMCASTDPSKREVLPNIAKARMMPKKVHRFFSERDYDGTDTWCIYNALMVLWNETEDVAYRLGIAKIHVDAFDKASTFKRKRFYLG